MHGRIIMSDERYLDENKRERDREREANISEINEGQVKTNPESVDERLNPLERERDLYSYWRATESGEQLSNFSGFREDV
jgi:hypothetical protein